MYNDSFVLRECQCATTPMFPAKSFKQNSWLGLGVYAHTLGVENNSVKESRDSISGIFLIPAFSYVSLLSIMYYAYTVFLGLALQKPQPESTSILFAFDYSFFF